MGKHHHDQNGDAKEDPRMRDPRMRDPRIRDPRTRDPRMADPNAGRNPRNSGNSSNVNNVAAPMGNLANGFNFMELLKGIDINQLIFMLTSLAGINNANISQLSSMIRNLDLSDLEKKSASSGATAPNGITVNDMRSQLSILADQLDAIGKTNNNSVQGELSKAIQTLQQSPDLMNLFNSFVNANMPKPPNKD